MAMSIDARTRARLSTFEVSNESTTLLPAASRAFEMEAQEVHKNVRSCDTDLANHQVEGEMELDGFTDTIDRFTHALKVQHLSRMHFDDDTTKKLSESQQDVSHQMLRVRQERHACETSLEKLAEERVVEGRACLQHEIDARNVAMAYNREIGDEICHLYSDIERCRQYRVEKGERLAEAVQVKLEEVRDAVDAEQRIRQESDATMLEMLGEMGSRMQKSLTQAKHEREASTERVIELMERILPQLNGINWRDMPSMRDQVSHQTDIQAMAATVQNHVRASVARRTQADLPVAVPSGRKTIIQSST